MGFSSSLFFWHEWSEDECDCQQCARHSHGSEWQIAESGDNIVQRREITIRTSRRAAFQQGEGEGATGILSQHRVPPVVVGMAHPVAEDPRDRPCFGLGQLTHEIDSFQRPTATNLSSQHNETSPAICTRELRVRWHCGFARLLQKRLHRALHTFGGVVHQRRLEIPAWCSTQTGEVHQPPPQDRGRWRRHSWTREPASNSKDEPRLARTRALEWAARWWPVTSSGWPHRQLRGRGPRKPEATEEEDAKHLRSENEEVGRWDAREWQTRHWLWTHQSVLGVREVPDNLLGTNLHRLRGKELPPMTWNTGVTPVQRALFEQQRRPERVPLSHVGRWGRCPINWHEYCHILVMAEENLVGIGNVLQMWADVRIGANFLWRCSQIPRPEFGMWVHQFGSNNLSKSRGAIPARFHICVFILDLVVAQKSLNGVHFERSLRRRYNVNVVMTRQKTLWWFQLMANDGRQTATQMGGLNHFLGVTASLSIALLDIRLKAPTLSIVGTVARSSRFVRAWSAW